MKPPSSAHFSGSRWRELYFVPTRRRSSTASASPESRGRRRQEAPIQSGHRTRNSIRASQGRQLTNSPSRVQFTDREMHRQWTEAWFTGSEASHQASETRFRTSEPDFNACAFSFNLTKTPCREPEFRFRASKVRHRMLETRFRACPHLPPHAKPGLPADETGAHPFRKRADDCPGMKKQMNEGR